MTKRQAKKHNKKVDKLAIFSFEIAEMYMKRYNLKESK